MPEGESTRAVFDLILERKDDRGVERLTIDGQNLRSILEFAEERAREKGWLNDHSTSQNTYDNQIDRIFEALAAAEELLSMGRDHGLVVGLSPALAAAIARRHGKRAEMVINNTWRVDPKGRIDAES